MKRLFIILSLLFWNSASSAQTETISDINWPNLEAEGQIVQLRWVPAGKKMKFFLVGHEGATVDLSKMKIEATDLKRRGRIIPVEKEDDYFLINNEPRVRELRLRIGDDKESEDVEVKLR